MISILAKSIFNDIKPLLDKQKLEPLGDIKIQLQEQLEKTLKQFDVVTHTEFKAQELTIERLNSQIIELSKQVEELQQTIDKTVSNT